MAGSKGLATSGKRWGLSCVVTDEASMGVILGHMKLFGATDIGFDIIGPVKKPSGKKNPKSVEAGRKGGMAKRAPPHSRKPLLDVAKTFLSPLKAAEEFKVSDFATHMKKGGWSNASVYTALNNLIDQKAIKRQDLGVYKRTELKLVA